jgi:ABC-type dipeptide/oligopeptide/nickel transport system permease component
MRGLLIPGEAAAVLAFLYVFGTFLPAAALKTDPCAFTVWSCSSCSWSNPQCVLTAFGGGFEIFLVRMFTGGWGFASYGPLFAPVTQLLAWWLPYSIELALVALAMTIAIAYPLGLLSGLRADSPVDLGARVGSTLGLLVPSFLILLVVFGFLYQPFVSSFGDEPYGILPSFDWFAANGGVPAWVGLASNTSPTGFPLVDCLWNHDWAAAQIVAVKTLIQAAVIAVIYVPIYLRYLRQVVGRALDALWVTAARARGVSEGRILWHHAGRRALPVYLAVFATTVPAFIGTQMVVEAISGDPGVGPILLSEVVYAPLTGFGFAGPGVNFVTAGNFYQVLIFLAILLILVARFAADVLARYLDPRLLSEVGR